MVSRKISFFLFFTLLFVSFLFQAWVVTFKKLARPQRTNKNYYWSQRKYASLFQSSWSRKRRPRLAQENQDILTGGLDIFTTDRLFCNIPHSESHHCFCNELVKFVRMQSIQSLKFPSNFESSTNLKFDRYRRKMRERSLPIPGTRYSSPGRRRERETSVQTGSYEEILRRSYLKSERDSYLKGLTHSFPVFDLNDGTDWSPRKNFSHYLSDNDDHIQKASEFPATRIPILMSRLV